MTHRSFYPFAKPLNEQLQALKNRMQAHMPCIDRVSFAKYHPRQDMLISFADTEFNNWDLAHYEAPLRKLPTCMPRLKTEHLVSLMISTTLITAIALKSCLTTGIDPLPQFLATKTKYLPALSF